MKLLELLETEISTKKIPSTFNVSRLEKKFQKRYDTSDPKSGSEGFIRQSELEPETTSKILHLPIRDPSENPTYVYYYTIAVHDLASKNQYFPEIKSIVNFKDRQGFIIPKFQMKTYYNMDNFKEPDIMKLGIRLFYNFQKYIKVKDIVTSLDLGKAIGDAIKDNYNKLGGRTTARDPKLLSALSIIKNIIEKNQDKKFYFDMHYGNFLINYDQGQLNLVLNDPIASMVSEPEFDQ